MKTTKIILAAMLGISIISVMPQQVSAEVENTNNQEATTFMQNYIQVYGQVSEKNDGSILIKNSTGANNDEILLNISEDTIIIDAVSGLPVTMKDVDLNEGIYAYIGHAMTLSLPPMTNAKVIVANVPQDFKVPNYIKVESIKKNNDGSITVISDGGRLEATLDSNTNVFPYLTRNIVTLNDIKVGSNLVIWEKINIDEMQKTKELPIKVNVDKCLMAPEDIDNIENEFVSITEEKTWKKENENWYYIENGVKAKGWIKDNNKWYYLNNEGIMQTGWVKENGNWYFLNEDGSMKTGWVLSNGDYYYLNASGDMAKNQYVDGYYLGANGAWVK